MKIEIIDLPEQPTKKIFRLDGVPSVLNSDIPLIITQPADADAAGTPAIREIKISLQSHFSSATLKAIEETNESARTDALLIEVRTPDTWDTLLKEQSIPQDQWKSAQDKIIEILKAHLSNKNAIKIVPDTRDYFNISAQDIQDFVDINQPDNVSKHNKNIAEKPFTVTEWDGENITIKPGANCATNDRSICGEIGQQQTFKTVSSYLGMRYPRANITILSPQ